MLPIYVVQLFLTEDESFLAPEFEIPEDLIKYDEGTFSSSIILNPRFPNVLFDRFTATACSRKYFTAVYYNQPESKNRVAKSKYLLLIDQA